MKMIMTSFGAHLPGGPKQPRRLSEMFPPCVVDDGEFELDFAPLLIVDRLIVDAHTFEYVRTCELPFLDRVKKTLRTLHEEGFIELQDYQEIASRNASVIAKANEVDLRYPARWLPEVRQEIAGWARMQTAWRPAMGRFFDDWVACSFGVSRHLQKRGLEVRQSTLEPVMTLVRSSRSRWTENETEVLRNVVEPYLSYINLNRILRDTFDAPIRDWDTLDGFYRTRSVTSMEAASTSRGANERRESQVLEQSNRMFEIALPNLKPRSVDHLLRLLRHKDVKNVRRRLENAIENQEEIDETWGTTVMQRALESNMKLISASKATNRIGSLVSLLPGASIPAILGSEIADIALARKFENEHRWLSCLIETTS